MKKIYFLALLSLVVAACCSKDDDYLDPNRNIAQDFDPLFAQELQTRGYVADAEHITPAEVKNITELWIPCHWDSESQKYTGELTSLRGIEYFESLEMLDCSFNRLTSLDVSKNTSLKSLSCHSNQLTSLDVSKNPLLEKLWCSDNPLTSLDVNKNPALTELYCYSNQLTSLNVSSNPALNFLNCYNNQLTSLDVSKNSALAYLSCSGNPGDGAVFLVTAWFGNDNVPSESFTTESWEYDGKTVRIDYRKAE